MLIKEVFSRFILFFNLLWHVQIKFYLYVMLILNLVRGYVMSEKTFYSL